MASNSSSAYTDIYREFHLPVLITASCFAAIAVILSIYLILQHLRSYTNPAVSSFHYKHPIHFIECSAFVSTCVSSHFLLDVRLKFYGVWLTGFCLSKCQIYMGELNYLKLKAMHKSITCYALMRMLMVPL